MPESSPDDKLPGVRALVTGATGFVGSHLADLLLEQGWDVVCAVRKSSNLRWLNGKRVRLAEVDFGRPESFEMSFDGVDVVFHVAGLIKGRSFEEYLEGNWLASRTMIEATLRYGPRVRRFVHVSSLAAAGPSPDGRPLDESAPCRPISMYGRSKLLGEQEVWKRRHEVPVTVVRPPVVYGTRDTGLLEVYRVVRSGFAPNLGGRRYVSIVNVAELVRGIVQAGTSEQGRNQIYFICNETPWAIDRLMKLVARLIHRRVRHVYVPTRLVLLAGELASMLAQLTGRAMVFNRDKASEIVPKHWTCTPSKFKGHFGWTPRIPLEIGFRDVLDWYRGQGLV